MSPRWECLSVGVAVADHLCVPIEHIPRAGELVVTERLDVSIGGNAANVSVDLAKLNVRVGIVARVGTDMFGRYLREELTTANVDTSTLIDTPGVNTSGTLIVNVRGEDRRFIHEVGANGHFEGHEISSEWLSQTRVLYVGGFFLLRSLKPETVARLFQQARALGVITVLDIVLPGPWDYPSALKTVLPHTDVFLPNHDEAILLTGLEDPVAQAECLHHLGAKTAVVTCGADGAVVISAEERFRSGIYPVEFVDGTGSGDAFDAGYIYGLLKGATRRQCVALGSAMGASCVRRSGATLGVFHEAELLEFLDGHPLEIQPL